MESKTVNILGTEWLIEFKDYDPGFEVGQGFCCECEKRIAIENVKKSDDPKQRQKNLFVFQKGITDFHFIIIEKNYFE